jgi:hypothetical protein
LRRYFGFPFGGRLDIGLAEIAVFMLGKFDPPVLAYKDQAFARKNRSRKKSHNSFSVSITRYGNEFGDKIQSNILAVGANLRVCPDTLSVLLTPLLNKL